MTDTEKLNKIKALFQKQIDWYILKLEEKGQDYVYDELYDQFSDVRRGDWLDLMEVLVKPIEKV